jgi:hypothetical protein
MKKGCLWASFFILVNKNEQSSNFHEVTPLKLTLLS